MDSFKEIWIAANLSLELSKSKRDKMLVQIEGFLQCMAIAPTVYWRIQCLELAISRFIACFQLRSDCREEMSRLEGSMKSIFTHLIKLSLSKEFVLLKDTDLMRCHLKVTISVGKMRCAVYPMIHSRFNLMWSMVNDGLKHPLVDWFLGKVTFKIKETDFDPKDFPEIVHIRDQLLQHMKRIRPTVKIPIAKEFVDVIEDNNNNYIEKTIAVGTPSEKRSNRSSMNTPGDYQGQMKPCPAIIVLVSGGNGEVNNAPQVSEIRVHALENQEHAPTAKCAEDHFVEVNVNIDNLDEAAPESRVTSSGYRAMGIFDDFDDVQCDERLKQGHTSCKVDSSGENDDLRDPILKPTPTTTAVAIDTDDGSKEYEFPGPKKMDASSRYGKTYDKRDSLVEPNTPSKVRKVLELNISAHPHSFKLVKPLSSAGRMSLRSGETPGFRKKDKPTVVKTDALGRAKIPTKTCGVKKLKTSISFRLKRKMPPNRLKSLRSHANEVKPETPSKPKTLKRPPPTIQARRLNPPNPTMPVSSNKKKTTPLAKLKTPDRPTRRTKTPVSSPPTQKISPKSGTDEVELESLAELKTPKLHTSVANMPSSTPKMSLRSDVEQAKSDAVLRAKGDEHLKDVGIYFINKNDRYVVARRSDRKRPSMI